MMPWLLVWTIERGKLLAFTEVGNAGKGTGLGQIILTLIWNIQMERPSRLLIIWIWTSG